MSPYLDESNYSGGVEDCLYLNVYTNAKPSNTGPYPVLFYLHGGGLMGGSTADDQFGGFIAHGSRYPAAPLFCYATPSFSLRTSNKWRFHALDLMHDIIFTVCV